MVLGRKRASGGRPIPLLSWLDHHMAGGYGEQAARQGHRSSTEWRSPLGDREGISRRHTQNEAERAGAPLVLTRMLRCRPLARGIARRPDRRRVSGSTEISNIGEPNDLVPAGRRDSLPLGDRGWRRDERT